jgi:predicted small metal-binding protein
MADDLKKVSCDPTCGFQVISHDEDELINIVKMHAKNIHKDNLSDDDVKSKMQPA